MFPKSLTQSALLLFVSAALASAPGCSCGSDDTDPPDKPDASVPGEPSIASDKANLKFKNGDRLANELSYAVDIPTNELCNELGLYSCVDIVHTITLMGVEPYVLGVTRPLAETGATTPIAAERMAISACGERVDRDFASPASAVLFADLPLSGDALSDKDAPEVDAAITTLYERGLKRLPTAEEIGHLKDLYDEVEALGGSEPAKDWAKASCFAVLTTLEFLFY